MSNTKIDQFWIIFQCASYLIIFMNFLYLLFLPFESILLLFTIRSVYVVLVYVITKKKLIFYNISNSSRRGSILVIRNVAKMTDSTRNALPALRLKFVVYFQEMFGTKNLQ